MVGRSTVPKPVSVVGTQMTSRQRDTTLITAVIAFPYLALNGSNMVINFLSLIGSTKNMPPTLVKRRLHTSLSTSMGVNRVFYHQRQMLRQRCSLTHNKRCAICQQQQSCSSESSGRCVYHFNCSHNKASANPCCYKKMTTEQSINIVLLVIM